MSRRTVAGLVAMSLLLGLWLCAILVPVPYVTFHPGMTLDVLGEKDGEEIVQISGHRSYHDGGELRMTTVSVTAPDGQVNLVEALGAWFDPDDAIYPHDAIYPPGQSVEEADTESAVDMLSSQDKATAVDLRKLGYDVPEVMRVLYVVPDLPGDGRLRAGDELISINGAPATTMDEVNAQLDLIRAGEQVTYEVRRDGKVVTEQVVPEEINGHVRTGVVPGTSYEFPFEVDVNVPEEIGGPSAGLMFTLAIYDTLTPGSLTDGHAVAGTGTIDENGAVGKIGGVQQKVVGAEDAGADLFLVPEGDCADALAAPRDDIRLVKVTTFDDALASVEAWADDPDQTLPTCEEN